MRSDTRERRGKSAVPKCARPAIGLILVSVAIMARAQSPFDGVKTFSATAVMSGMPSHAPQGAGGMKIYRSGDLIRTVMPGGTMYTIMDLKQHTSFMVRGGMCMQMTTQGQETPFAPAQDAAVERSSAGTAVVDGHACKVENLTITPHSGPRAGQTTKMTVYEAQDLKGFPIKVETQTSHGLITMEYKDVSLAEPDASLFAHPDNCQQMPAMPGGAPH